MIRRTLPALALLIAGLAAVADDPIGVVPRTRPLEPADALKSFDLPAGLRLELVASEPLIRSPVAMDFDENGRLFVVEFPEYNQQANPAFRGHGCVKLLEDTDDDGRYDKATVYVDNLAAPVAVACWDGGIFVGVVPDLWYFKDTHGDGKVDVRRHVLTGFERDKAGEAMLNSFRWTTDNRLLIATGHAGGQLRHADRPNERGVSVRRQNVRLDPRTGQFTTTSGGGQHGLTLDDWGDTFVCDNSNPLQHLTYDGRYLARNPHVEAPSPIVDINAAGRHPNLHRISPPEPWREIRTRLRNQKLFDGPNEGGTPFGFFTGCTGITVYRGDALPAEYRGQLFVGEVANNLVYRARLEPKHLSWSAVRADAGREFLASRDIWFRPVQFANAPDGALYLVDMYRELIETVESMPPDLLKHVDVAGGIDRGRIYRLIPDNFQPRKPPRLGSATTAELVALLAHPNGWHRDTAARLLYQRQDPTAVAALRALAESSPSALARMHAWHALEGMNQLTATDVIRALHDPEPRLREHALRMAEPMANTPSVRSAMFALVDNPERRVQYQLAFSLGAIRGDAAVDVLSKLSLKGELRLAVLCSAGECGGSLFAHLMSSATSRDSASVRAVLPMLASQIVSANRTTDVARLGTALDQLTDDDALIRAIVRSAASKPGAIPGAKSQAILKEILAEAQTTASNSKASVANRVAALRTLGRASLLSIQPLIQDCLSVRQPPPVQTAALEVLARFNDAGVPVVILEAWSGMSPPVRATATETLFARPAWIRQLLDAVAQGRVRPADLDPARVQLLLKSIDPTLRSRAEELLRGAILSTRKDVLARYQQALARPGDSAKGKLVFKQVCAVCHHLDGVGTAVGPDLATIRNNAVDTILVNILDPNREVLPKYYTYLLTTDAGVAITGLITTETANTVTIRRADGTTATVQRVNIEQLASTGHSAMPEGMEKQIDVAAMADLLAYLVKRP